MLAKSMHQIARIEFRNSKFPYARGLCPLATPARGPAPWNPRHWSTIWAPLPGGWIRPWTGPTHMQRSHWCHYQLEIVQIVIDSMLFITAKVWKVSAARTHQNREILQVQLPNMLKLFKKVCVAEVFEPHYTLYKCFVLKVCVWSCYVPTLRSGACKTERKVPVIMYLSINTCTNLNMIFNILSILIGNEWWGYIFPIKFYWSGCLHSIYYT